MCGARRPESQRVLLNLKSSLMAITAVAVVSAERTRFDRRDVTLGACYCGKKVDLLSDCDIQMRISCGHDRRSTRSSFCLEARQQGFCRL